MVKVVGLFKKRAGLSDEEFRDHYENHHMHLFDELVGMPGVKRAARRYLAPVPAAGGAGASEFDVLMEVWCDEEWYESFFVDQPPAQFRATVAADESRLFEADRMQLYVVHERTGGSKW